MHKLPQTPYFAVIFTSLKTQQTAKYQEIATKMEALATAQQGYLGHESYRNQNGEGCTISYWTSLQSIAKWKQNSDHLLAQQLGKKEFYQHYTVRIAEVNKHYQFQQ